MECMKLPILLGSGGEAAAVGAPVTADKELVAAVAADSTTCLQGV